MSLSLKQVVFNDKTALWGGKKSFLVLDTASIDDDKRDKLSVFSPTSYASLQLRLSEKQQVCERKREGGFNMIAQLLGTVICWLLLQYTPKAPKKSTLADELSENFPDQTDQTLKALNMLMKRVLTSE